MTPTSSKKKELDFQTLDKYFIWKCLVKLECGLVYVVYSMSLKQGDL